MAITNGRRLDVRPDSPHGGVAWRRQQFDQHITECEMCQPEFCSVANAMWRVLCLAALRAQDGA